MTRVAIEPALVDQELPGTYRRVIDAAGLVMALIWCPRCGGGAALRHQILPDGDVHPSYVCPHTGCDFHEWVRLEGWVP